MIQRRLAIGGPLALVALCRPGGSNNGAGVLAGRGWHRSRADAGVHDVRLTFARGTRRSDLGASTDQRDLAAAIDYVRVVVEP